MRERDTVLSSVAGVRHVEGSSPSPVYLTNLVWKTRLLLGDKGNYGYPNFPTGKDCGQPFQVATVKGVFPKMHVGSIYAPSLPNRDTYTGYVTPDMILDGFLDNSAIAGLFDYMKPFGPGAYKRMRPDAPSMQGAVAIYELKDLPGMLEQRFLNHGIAGIGNYYLALKFGWEALLSDVRNFVLTQMSAQKRLAQLIRDNGRPVRRRIKLEDRRRPIIENVYGYPILGFQPTLPSQYIASQSVILQNRYQFWETWASGQFRYWLPPGPRDIAWKARMMANIFGINPSPAAVYKAIPWTWLVDWFTTLGDVIDNLTDSVAERGAYDYFYLMCTSGIFTSLGCTFTFHDANSGQPKVVSGTSTCETSVKGRIKGDPFSLSTSPNTLTGTQLAILGALGLSRIG